MTDEVYDRQLALVPSAVERFLKRTQLEKVQKTMCFANSSESNKFFNRLKDAITKKGVLEVLRGGFDYNGQSFVMYYPTPDILNPTAKIAYEENMFMAIRQVHYSTANENSIDIVVLMNGLPLMTIELKNSLTGQHTDDAILQYKSRDPKELIFQPKRCAVHMAVDDAEIWMCTKLDKKNSWFLPFNRGFNGGAGNPVVEGDIKTSYLWKEILTKETLSNIIENFAQDFIWPRYHQLACVNALTQDTYTNGVGNRYLIQHSAGSGKSNSITWLAYQLVNMKDADRNLMFNSVVVVTDRVNLDKQIRDNIQKFEKRPDLVGWASDSEELRKLLIGGKPIIVTVINKFSYILDEIGTTLKDRQFAIIIDEAHSSQNGSLSTSMGSAISGKVAKVVPIYEVHEESWMAAEDPAPYKMPEEEDIEDTLNRIIEGRLMAKNANYYAFTATPKNKTLEMFGRPVPHADGKIGHEPFHLYTMKQAIEEGFILDVLKHYTTFNSYYNILKNIQDDPVFDKKRSLSKIRAWVEGQPQTISHKAEVIVDHFCKRVAYRVGGKARAMVVTSSIERAIEFYKEITRLLVERKSAHRAVVAFTQKMIDDELMTEEKLNGFPSSEIEKKMKEEPYRILIVADKFQTGYDEPLLHTMYVDKMLSDLKAVQTLSRLNRCHPLKNDTFVLDFANDAETIQQSFQRYYKATILSEESDVNKLNDLIDIIEETPFYTKGEIDEVVALKVHGTDEDRPMVDSMIDIVVERFKAEESLDWKIKVKSAVKNYCRFYQFISSISPFISAEWEKKFIFYCLLVKKLPKLGPDDDFTEGLLESIDMEKYQLERNEEKRIMLEDENAQIGAVPVGTGRGVTAPEMVTLSDIIQQWNETHGNPIKYMNEALKQASELPERMASCVSFVNAVRNSDEQTAMIQFNADMMQIVASMLEEKAEFVQLYFQNTDFQQLINRQVFQMTWKEIKEKHNVTDVHIHGDFVNDGATKIVR